jgi:hypothetical protein
MRSNLDLLIEAFDCKIVDVNHYCQDCSKGCEEVIPTYNCEKQMNIQNIEKILEEFKNANNIANTTIMLLIDEIKRENDLKVGEPTAGSVILDYKKLSKKEQRRVFTSCFGLDKIGDSIDAKLILVSLIVSTYLAMKKKDSSKTIRDAINMLVEGCPNKIPEEYLDKLEVICDEFAYGVTAGNTFGLKNISEIKAKVHEILANVLPF